MSHLHKKSWILEGTWRHQIQFHIASPNKEVWIPIDQW